MERRTRTAASAVVALILALSAVTFTQGPAAAPGDVAFTPSAGAVLYYEARAYAEGTTTPIRATKYLGVPGVDAVSGKIKVNCATMLNALPAGNYDLIIAAVSVEGIDESAHETAIAVPLQP